MLIILSTAIALAMDAFSVSICKGLKQTKINYKLCFLLAIFFGFFQAFMPVIGYYLGKSFEKIITPIDHWIIFILLAFIGGKMIYEAITEKEEDKGEEKIDFKEIIILSIATSLDALAVGIAFALHGDDIWLSVLAIGVVTAFLSFVGCMFGKFLAKYLKNYAGIFGGIVLIGIGIKVLIEHLFF